MKEEFKKEIISYILENVKGEIVGVESQCGGLWIDTTEGTFSLILMDTEDEDDKDTEHTIIESFDPYWGRLSFDNIKKATGVELYGLNEDQLEVELIEAKAIWDKLTFAEKHDFFTNNVFNS